MRPGFFYYRRRMDRRVLARLLLFVGMTLVLATAVYATAQLRPLLESMATTRVSNTVNRIVFEAVNEAIESGEITYDQLISFEKDNDGKITAVHSNMAAFNRLQAQILDIILAKIDQVSARELSIPIGTLTGSALLAGRGPRIRVRMESVGSSTARFNNQFESAGINQTKHQINLEVIVDIDILVPWGTESTQVITEVLIADTIVVGRVPDTYLSMESGSTEEN